MLSLLKTANYGKAEDSPRITRIQPGEPDLEPRRLRKTAVEISSGSFNLSHSLYNLTGKEVQAQRNVKSIHPQWIISSLAFSKTL